MKNASQLAETITENIDGFLQNEIKLARRAIVEIAKSKISDGDVVLTYARYVCGALGEELLAAGMLFDAQRPQSYVLFERAAQEKVLKK